MTVELEKYLTKCDLKSFSHATSNENGDSEFEIEFQPTFIQSLFHKPGTKFVFVRPKLAADLSNLADFAWRDKVTGERVDTEYSINQFIMSNP